ncbi:murein hydrolase activator EnvC family protein [Bacillus salipaludis]|uniref:Peptidoglycan DD-metalloendopeptidase family protein n=1 Tax=Bacillus salipaludis TaxID=2547811 RepID=A0AA90R053_9BACI|nr:peptidoglycan DD-metalloendopeptidase family protein [Bacillus salipaludis]MDQ6600334.1 peptidoglycan DD-metalloendopeptidase family protein [Bacillus salipaludis]
MKKSVVAITVAASMGIGSLFTGSSLVTEAASISNLKDKQNEIHNKRSNLKSDINDANTTINDLQGQQANVKSEMKRLDFAIGDTNAKIRDKTAKIGETQGKINQLQGEIQVIVDRMEKRNNLLKERARNYQETGGMINYIDVLMGAKSFSDFIDRANAVATIMEADQELLKQADMDKKELEEKRMKVEEDLANLQEMKSELEQMNKQLSTQRAAKDKLLSKLVRKEKEVHEGKLALEEEEQILAGQEAAVQKAIQLEKDRQAAAAAAAKAAKAPAQPSGGGASGKAPAISGGTFTRPASGIISSGFGTRPGFRPGEFHYGVDIANHASNVPILAAADGVVIRSYYSNSYGNCIFISHSINGQVYTTVYAHMEARLAETGAVVKKGQQIGIMGSTGDSTGQHLHFELHRGQWVPDRHNAINPVGIVPL